MLLITLVKVAPGRAQEAMEKMKALGEPPAGVKVHSAYLTFGQYDFVAVWEAGSQEAASSALLQFSSQVPCTTETMLAQAMGQ